MDNIKLVTQSNYTVEILPSLNYGQYLEIQKVIQSKMSLNVETKTVDKLDGSTIFDANTKALEILIVKITDPAGKELPDPASAVNSLPVNDGIEVSEKIQEIWTTAISGKKKATE